MKKRIIAMLTLAIFSLGVFGGSAMAMAMQNAPVKAGDVTVTNVPIKNASGNVVNIPDMLNLELKDGTKPGARTAYSFNYTKTPPSQTGSSGYVLASDQGESGYNNLATKLRTELDTLRNHVRNVIWNGYPYFAGEWKGVVGDPAGYGNSYGLTNPLELTRLYNMQVTQQAIWYYTDTRVANEALTKNVAVLMGAAALNPAPANFKLDLYNGDVPKTQHVVGLVQPATDAKNVVKVQVNSKWFDEDGMTAYTDPTPAVSYEVYEGNTASADKLLATYKAGKDGLTSISLINDKKTYTIREVMASDQDSFKVEKNDQVVDLSQPVAPLTFNKVFTGRVPSVGVPETKHVSVKGEVTLDGKRPDSGVYTFTLRDSAGNIEKATNDGRFVVFKDLSFDKEGTYVYTMAQEKGTDANINYDSAVYELTVTVTKEVINNRPILIDKVSWKKDGAPVSIITPVFANTSKADNDTSLTVNKVWKNDKASSRPSYVDVQLYRNGTAYGELVRLNAANKWTYTWNDLDSDYKWTVNEPTVPKGYIKTLSNSGTTWTITNSGKNTPTITAPTTNKNNGVKTTLPVTNRSTPQTDDPSQLNLWTTVGIVSLSGLCLVGILWILNRRKQGGSR